MIQGKKINDGEFTHPKRFIKHNESDTVWWVDNPDVVGDWLFTFDKKIIFNMFKDYPYKLTAKQKAIFDKENPEWANFFKDRQK